MDELDDLNEQEKRIADLADRMLKRGRPREEVESFVARAMERQGRNRRDVENAGQINGLTKAATVAGEFADGATFGLTGLLGDAAAAGFDPNLSFADVREMRAAREKQTGVVGGIANLAGGLMTGGASLNAVKDIANAGRIANAIKSMANGGRLAKAGLAAGDAALQGGVSSAAQGMREGSWQGAKNAAKSGLVGAGAGLLLGGTVGAATGAGAGKGAQWIAGRRLAQVMERAGINPQEAKAVTNQLSGATESDINRAVQRLSELEARGIRGDAVMAADVLGAPAQDVVRNAGNIGAGDLARDRIRARDAGIVGRSRADIADAAGYSPSEMDATEDALLSSRNTKARRSYQQTIREGAQYDALPSQVKRMPAPETAPQPNPSVREAIDAHRTRLGQSVTRKEGTSMQQTAREALERHGSMDEFASPSLSGQPTAMVDNSALPLNYDDVLRITEDAANDPVALRTFNALAQKNPQKYGTADLRDFNTMLRTYQAVNKEIRAIENSAAPDYNRLDGLYTAKAAMGESLAARSKTFRAANADYFEASRGLEAYRGAQSSVRERLPSEMRREMASVRQADRALWKKGGVDSWAEEMGAGPNPDLGAAATAKQSVGKMTTGTQNAAEKLKLLVGDEGYQRAIQNAKDEALFAQTSHVAQGNSTTAKQMAGMNDALGVVADIAGGFSMNPAWWATMTGRRLAGDEMGRILKALSKKQLATASDVLTRQGSENARHTLQMILEELARRRAAQQAGAVVSRNVRSGVARSTGRDY